MGRNRVRLDPIQAEARRIAAAALIVQWEDTESQARRVAEFAAAELITAREQRDRFAGDAVAGDESMVLYSTNTSGNVHQTCSWVNEKVPELAPHLVQIEFNGGHHSVAVFRAPRSLIERLREEKKIW